MRIVALLILMVSLSSWAQETSVNFVDGIQALQNKDYEKSKEIFSQLLAEHPQNPALLYNLGLSQYHLGQKGLALGLWRKARFLNPSMKQAKAAIQYAEEELFPDRQQPGAFYGIYTWLKSFSPHLWLALSFLGSLFFFWTAITLVARRKEPFSQWPVWQYSLIPLLIFTFVFSIITSLEFYHVKATVIGSDAITRATPSETAPTLASLSEGLLVNVERRMDDWVQIRTSTGAPGWIKKDKLLILER